MSFNGGNLYLLGRSGGFNVWDGSLKVSFEMRRLSVSKQKEIFDSGSGKAKFFIGEKSERLA